MVMNIPSPSKEPGQRSLTPEDIFLSKYIPTWTRPSALNGDLWRTVVKNQPIAMICRETLIANILALDWKISARDSNLQDELRPTIKYYTRLLEHGGYYLDTDYTGLVEWTLQDLLDLPFGGAVEIGRKNDNPTGRVAWIKPLDGATLFPTLNKNYPAIQYYQSWKPVVFPAYAFDRMYLSPRPELLREGWGMAPPEKIYFALELLWRGDKYYANLLLDIPPAGILDLGDMEKDSAMEWVDAFRNFIVGQTDSFRIPVLYEHTQKADFIPFGKPPSDIMYDRITLRYAAISAAAYGMSLSDIGLQTTSASGETLAGSIRQERRTKRTGFARTKKKIKYFIDSFLPEPLQFTFIDYDDELNVALGRARLANATSWNQMIDSGMVTPDEARMQTIQDGLITIAIPEKPPEVAPSSQKPKKKPKERPGMLGAPQSPSQGGHGEVKLSTVAFKDNKYLSSHIKRLVRDLTTSFAPILIESSEGLSEDDAYLLRSYVEESLFGADDLLGIGKILEQAWARKSWAQFSIEDLADELKNIAEEHIVSALEAKSANDYENGNTDTPDVPQFEKEKALKSVQSIDFEYVANRFGKNILKSFQELVGKGILYMLKDVLLAEDVVDIDDGLSYDNIVEQVHKYVLGNFDEFVNSSIEIETKHTLQEIEMEALGNEKAN